MHTVGWECPQRYAPLMLTCVVRQSGEPAPRTMREDIRPGLRTSSYKKLAVIATFVDDETQQLTILGVFYGGQDYDMILSGSENA